MAEKIIFDTDPGIDDTIALFLALASGKFDVLGLTTIFGNVHTDLATTNALRLLEIAGRTDIPVAHGADKPLVRPYHGPVPHIHGADGQGDVNLPPPSTKAIDQSAAQFIVEQVMAQPGEITLVPVGPLTNIALALSIQPKIAEKVKRVVLMGGAALVPGNVNPAAEANIFNDPEAAHIVFSAPWDVTMVGLDITHQVLMTDEQLKSFAASDKVTSQHIGRIIPLYLDFAHKMMGRQVMYMHDPTAISYLLKPELFETQQYPVRVETQGMSSGKTWVWSQSGDFPPEHFGYNVAHPATIVVGADVDAVNAMTLSYV